MNQNPGTASGRPRSGPTLARSRRARSLFPFLALGIGASASILLYQVMENYVTGEARLRFERRASDGQHNIEARVQSYVDMVYGLGALFRTSEAISRDAFHRYVTSLRLSRRYSGLQVLNFASYVTHAGKREFEERVRRDTGVDPRGYPEFKITPAGDRAEYYPLIYLDPMVGNEVSFGLDIGANALVIGALRRARDTGELSASGRLIKLGGSTEPIALAMRLPVYRITMPLDTVEQRRAAYIGSVGAGFRLRPIMEGVLDDSMSEYMRFSLYDIGPSDGDPSSRHSNDDRLLFDSASEGPAPDTAVEPIFRIDRRMEVGGRIWEVRFSAKKAAMVEPTDAILPWLTLAAGLISSVLVFFAVYSLRSSRIRNAGLAQAMATLKDAQERFVATEKLSALGRLIAQLSHEINNPVNVLKNNVAPVEGYLGDIDAVLEAARLGADPQGEVKRLWRERDLDFVRADIRDALSAMGTAADRIRAIHGELRAFLRGDSPIAVEGDLNDVVRATLAMLRRNLPPGVHLIEDYGQLPAARFHPNQVGQVVLNLVQNALDALRTTGEIRVATWAEAQGLSLAVTDSGPGVNEAARGHLFEPFFTTKEIGSGTGLGLATCYQIVQGHGGTITLDESHRTGARFVVKLPLVPPQIGAPSGIADSTA